MCHRTCRGPVDRSAGPMTRLSEGEHHRQTCPCPIGPRAELAPADGGRPRPDVFRTVPVTPVDDGPEVVESRAPHSCDRAPCHRRAPVHRCRAGAGDAGRGARPHPRGRRVDGRGRAGRHGVPLGGEHRPRRVERPLPERPGDGARHRDGRCRPRTGSHQPVGPSRRVSGPSESGGLSVRGLPRGAVRRVVRARRPSRRLHDHAVPERGTAVAVAPPTPHPDRPGPGIGDRSAPDARCVRGVRGRSPRRSGPAPRPRRRPAPGAVRRRAPRRRFGSGRSGPRGDRRGARTTSRSCGRADAGSHRTATSG